MANLEYHSISDATNGIIYAIQWPDEEDHCLNILMERLTDQEYLRALFKERKKELQFFNAQPIDAAVRTYKEALWITEDIKDICNQGVTDDGNTLDMLFAPLDDRIKSASFIQAKAKGDLNTAPWIRIYAIKIDANEYVITGGGIKLTEKMEEDPLLVEELKRLEEAESYFKQIGWL